MAIILEFSDTFDIKSQINWSEVWPRARGTKAILQLNLPQCCLPLLSCLTGPMFEAQHLPAVWQTQYFLTVTADWPHYCYRLSAESVQWRTPLGGPKGVLKKVFWIWWKLNLMATSSINTYKKPNLHWQKVRCDCGQAVNHFNFEINFVAILFILPWWQHGGHVVFRAVCYHSVETGISFISKLIGERCIRILKNTKFKTKKTCLSVFTVC